MNRSVVIAVVLVTTVGCAGFRDEAGAGDGLLVPSCVAGVRLGMLPEELEAARPNVVRGGKTWIMYYETGLGCRFFERADYIFDRPVLSFFGEARLSRVILTKTYSRCEDLNLSRDAFLSSAANAWGGEPRRFVRAQGLPQERHYLPVLTWTVSGVSIEAIYTPTQELDGRPFTLDNDPPPKQPLCYYELRVTSPAYWGLEAFIHPKPAGDVRGSETLYSDFESVARTKGVASGEWSF